MSLPKILEREKNSLISVIGKSFWSQGTPEFMPESNEDIDLTFRLGGLAATPSAWIHQRSFAVSEYNNLLYINISFSVQEFENGHIESFLIISADSDYLMRSQIKECFVIPSSENDDNSFTYDDGFGETRTLEADDSITSTLFLGDLDPQYHFDSSRPFEHVQDDGGHRDRLKDISDSFITICRNLDIKDRNLIRDGMNHLKEVVMLRDQIFKSYQQANLH